MVNARTHTHAARMHPYTWVLLIEYIVLHNKVYTNLRIMFQL